MSDHSNLTEDQELHAAEDERRRHLRGIFGDNIFIGLATDPPPTGPTRSALAHGQRRQKALRQQARERRQERIAAAAELDQDQRAYEQVMEDQHQGRPSTSQDQHRADRHIQRLGLLPVPTSAERLARQRS
jgi:hypothetical protein